MPNRTLAQPDPALATRNRVVEENLGLVYLVARRLQRAHRNTPLDELVSAGSVGLIRAAESFDPTFGVTFSTYAVPRIQGAMMDELRRTDPMPRGMRERQRALAGAVVGGEPANDYEIAERLGVEVSAVWRWRVEGASAAPQSLDAPVRTRGWGEVHSLRDVLPDENSLLPSAQVERLERAERLRAQIGRLTPREQTVLALYYVEELRLTDIGQVLGVSESRVSQILKKALGRLREEMSHAEWSPSVN